MLRKYYKFDLSKESLITTEQASYGSPTLTVGIYESTDLTPDLTDTTVERQDGTLISKGTTGTSPQG